MILSAIQHSCTTKDCYCMEPDHFIIRLRSARGDLAKVILHHQDKYMPLHLEDSRKQLEMQIIATDNTLDYWEAELSFHVVCLRYWFELIDTQGKTVYFSNFMFAETPFINVNDMFDCPQNMREEARFQTPEWAENKVIYQIFPSRFASHKHVPHKEWYKAPISYNDDLQGDLRGIIKHFDHFQNLGVDILYMTPIFRSNSCHKYDTIDYYTIEPTFGTKEDLRKLVELAHSAGMKVILDGVFNHTSPDFFAFDDIRKNKENSKYLNWYFIEGFPLQANYGEKPNYKTFSYYGGMPKLNLHNPEVRDYILQVALYWLRECQIDGWRLDVGDEIGHDFWRSFRSAVKAEFPDALITGEVWHYAEDFLQGDEWDTVMNYPFQQNVLQLIAQESISVSHFAGNLGFLKGQLHRRVYPLLWNLIDSHDTPRILNQCGSDKQKMKLIAALQLLLPGMPMIYYGDEYAMEGGQDPDCRRGMLWDPDRQDADMYQWYKTLIRLRKNHPEILNPEAAVCCDDALGLLTYRLPGTIIVFHCTEGTVQVPEIAGKTDLITGNPCSGTMARFSVCLVIE